MTDACACDTGGDCDCFCTAVAAYAQACSEVGVCIAWRTPSICREFYVINTSCEIVVKCTMPCWSPWTHTPDILCMCIIISLCRLFTLSSLDGHTLSPTHSMFSRLGKQHCRDVMNRHEVKKLFFFSPWTCPNFCLSLALFCDYYNQQGECEWHYKPCGASCMKTCRNPSGKCLHNLPGLEGKKTCKYL